MPFQVQKKFFLALSQVQSLRSERLYDATLPLFELSEAERDALVETAVELNADLRQLNKLARLISEQLAQGISPSTENQVALSSLVGKEEVSEQVETDQQAEIVALEKNSLIDLSDFAGVAPVAN